MSRMGFFYRLSVPPEAIHIHADFKLRSFFCEKTPPKASETAASVPPGGGSGVTYAWYCAWPWQNVGGRRRGKGASRNDLAADWNPEAAERQRNYTPCYVYHFLVSCFLKINLLRSTAPLAHLPRHGNDIQVALQHHFVQPCLVGCLCLPWFPFFMLLDIEYCLIQVRCSKPFQELKVIMIPFYGLFQTNF